VSVINLNGIYEKVEIEHNLAKQGPN